MDYYSLLFSVENRICTITLNRPSKRNAMDDVLIKDLTGALTLASKDLSIKVVIITGSGKAFCAGADVSYLQKGIGSDFEQNLEDSRKLMRMLQIVYSMRKPVIAAVNGPAIAGGCGVAAACDIVIASDSASFGCPEVRMGFIPAVIMYYVANRIGEGNTRALFLRGNTITTQDALRLGLVNEITSQGDLLGHTMKIAEELCINSSGNSMGLIKEMFSNSKGKNFDDTMEYAANMNALTRMTEDFKKGMTSFIRKEKIIW
jgi:methylglutaconyl-CoA hydratase